MKFLQRILGGVGALLALMFFARGTISSSTVVGDIVIENTRGSLYCDSMICPPEATTCHVVKRNSPHDFSLIVRVRKCIASNGTVLSQQTVYEDNPYQGNVNINVVSGGGGSSVVRELTPEEQRELEETLRRTSERVNEQVSNAMHNLHETLRPFQDGSFARNLNNRIQAQVRNSLSNAFNF